MCPSDSFGTRESGISEVLQATLKDAGWKLGPDFEKRYYTDSWVFNLVNLIERQAEALSIVREWAERSPFTGLDDAPENVKAALDYQGRGARDIRKRIAERFGV